MKKVIVIGLDGLEPSIVEPMLDGGELPHLARLRQQGGFTRIQTTFPAQTPVAWSTFATGTNPGGHGIFDFVRRDAKTYLPAVSLYRYEQKNAFLPPRAVNLRRGVPFWELLAAAGLDSTIIRFPCTYPPDNVRGRMLAGMGVPDLRGSFGTATVFTANEEAAARESETMIHVRSDAAGVIGTYLPGPRDPRTRTDFRCELKVHVDAAARKVTVRSDGQPRELSVAEGTWSDWLKVKFKTGLLTSVKGMVRFYLVALEPVFELYASPVNFDPSAPMFPISSPPQYARELETKVGTFYTSGMVEDHNGLNNGRLTDDAYLRQCDLGLRERERMMEYELQRFGQGFFFCLFDSPDRIQHMFWGPGVSPHDAIRQHYRKCDSVVGKAMEAVDGDTLLMVLSDHGMSGFQRGVHLNSWLVSKDLLALKEGHTPGTELDLLQAVDWSRTRAYALGLSGIYLNLKGREEQGIVDALEAERVRAEVVHGLQNLVDRKRGENAVRRVLSREEVYHGPYMEDAPDLLVNFAEHYRASWSTAMGGVASGHFEDNEKRWQGDHVVDPCLVPGVLFMNRTFKDADPRLLDMAPTILQALGRPRGTAMEGDSLL